MKEIALITKTRGINSAIDPRQIPLTDGGFENIAAAVNVNITDGFRIVRRCGYAAQRSCVAHSLFVHDGLGFGVIDNTLVRIRPNLTTIALRTGMTSDKVRYVGVGDKVFYSNTAVNGFIHADTDYAWLPGQYVGPDTVKEYVSPPVGKHLCLHRGRVYISDRSAIWYTEPMYYLGINKATNFIPISSDVRMLLSVGTALFVADEHSIYALVGTNPDDYTVVRVAADRVVEDTAVVVHKPVILGKQFAGPIGIFTAQNAIYAATPDGSIFDITENRLRMPYANTGNAYVKDGIYTAFVDA